MSPNRVFVSRALFDRWIMNGLAELDGATLRLRGDEGRFSVVEAAHVVREVTGAGDPHALVGTARELAFLVELGGEVMDTSLVVGEFAYDVVPGMLARPIAVGRHASARVETAVVFGTLYGLSETGDTRQASGELPARYPWGRLE